MKGDNVQILNALHLVITFSAGLQGPNGLDFCQILLCKKMYVEDSSKPALYKSIRCRKIMKSGVAHCFQHVGKKISCALD